MIFQFSSPVIYFTERVEKIMKYGYGYKHYIIPLYTLMISLCNEWNIDGDCLNH